MLSSQLKYSHGKAGIVKSVVVKNVVKRQYFVENSFTEKKLQCYTVRVLPALLPVSKDHNSNE